MATLDLPLAAAALEGPVEAAARGGDRSAWTELIQRHNRRVLLALMANGVLPSHAKEMAQEAWLRLITQADEKKLERLELPGLAIRQALFLAHSEQRKATTQAESLGEVPDRSGESFEELYFSRERLARARERVRDLSPSARAVFERLYGEPHLSHAEVATRVGLSVQRVRQIICEVRKVLRAELEEP
ncbi:MAG: sigma-70 family RNA polymerase sigma factor [Myxococcaceae bacterium]